MMKRILVSIIMASTLYLLLYPMSIIPAVANTIVEQNNNNNNDEEEEKKKKKKEDKTWFRVRLALFSQEDTPDSPVAPVMHTVHNESSFPIEDETLYGIELHNRMSGKSAAAAVYIDGRLQGEFLLRPKQRFILERPKNETRRFLFLRRGVPSASSTIYIRLVPERVSDKVIVLSRTPHLSPHTQTSTTESHTFLSEHSTQQFSPPLLSISFNEAAATTLHFQLVCTTSKYTNVLPLVDCRALPALSTITRVPM